MSSLWNWLFNDVDWNSVSNQGRKLSDAARRNLITTSAICAIAGSFSAGVGLVGSYSPRATYCDPRTKPCTKVEVNSFDSEALASLRASDLPVNTDAKYLPGYGLQRTAGSVLAVLLFGGGLFAIAKAEEDQVEVEPQLQLDRQLKIKQLEIEANVELQNLENLAQTRVEVNEQELKESIAELFFERNPEAIAFYAPKPEPKPQTEDPKVEEKMPNPWTQPEPEAEKIPPGIEIMLNSGLREIVDAGILSLVGSQGSGKTTTSCMLLRYRVWKGHKLIIVNPHKKKSMYVGLDPYLLPGTTFYGVGMGDYERAQSLLDGLEFIKKHVSDRYDEYQNLEEDEYDHFPVTTLLEECAEYEGLLNVFNRPANPKEGDPGFSAKKYLTLFWMKFFVATRKGNNFGIRTIQYDSNTMNGTQGMAELIKSQGACKLTQFSTPDGDCVGGWRSTGEGEIEIPNMKDAEGKPVDSKPVTVPTWFDYKKVLDPTDFRDLGGNKLKVKSQETVVTNEELEVKPIVPPVSPTQYEAPVYDSLPADLLKVAVERLNQSLELPSPDNADSQLQSELDDIVNQISPIPSKQSGFEWTATKVTEFYSKSTAQGLFGEVSAALRTGAKVRDVITNILKCKGGRSHKTRSYTTHGKTLMIWLLTNYGDEALLQLDKVKRFLDEN